MFDSMFDISLLTCCPAMAVAKRRVGVIVNRLIYLREDVKIPTYKPHTNHKRSSVRSHTLAPTSICDFSHSLYWSPLTHLGHINSVTYVCHPLWFVCGHRKGILTSPPSGYGPLVGTALSTTIPHIPERALHAP